MEVVMKMVMHSHAKVIGKGGNPGVTCYVCYMCFKLLINVLQ